MYLPTNGFNVSALFLPLSASSESNRRINGHEKPGEDPTTLEEKNEVRALPLIFQDYPYLPYLQLTPRYSGCYRPISYRRDLEASG